MKGQHLRTTANAEIARLVYTANHYGESMFIDMRGLRIVARATDSLRENVQNLLWTFWMLIDQRSVVTATFGERNEWPNLVREMPQLRTRLMEEFASTDHSDARSVLQWLMRLSLLTWREEIVTEKVRSTIIDTLDQYEKYEKWYNIPEYSREGKNQDARHVMRVMRRLQYGKFDKMLVSGVDAWLQKTE